MDVFELKSIKEEFEDIFSRYLLDEEYSNLNEPRSYAASLIAERNSHPVIRYHKIFLLDEQRALDTGEVRLHSYSLWIVELVLMLRYLKSCVNYERLVGDLRVKNKFYSTLAEIRIASHYKISNYIVDINDEAGSSGPTPDLTVSSGEDHVLVEVKSLEDLDLVEGQRWNTLCLNLHKEARAAKRSVDISLLATGELTDRHIGPICKAVREDLKQDNLIKKEYFLIKTSL